MKRGPFYLFVILFCCLYWIIDSYWSYLSYETNLKVMIFTDPKSFVDTLLLKVPPYQVVSRIIVILIFIISGVIIFEFFKKIKTAQNALKKSEKKYRELFENANEAIFVVENFIMQFSNPKTWELFGLNKSDLIEKDISRFIDPRDREMVTDYHRRRLKGEKVPDLYSFRIIDREHNVRWVELKGVRIEWDKKPAALCFMTDISRRKKTEELLTESERFHRSLFEDSPTALFIQDFSGVKQRIDELKKQNIQDLKAWLTKHPEEVAAMSKSVVTTRVNQAACKLYKAATPEELLTNLDRFLIREDWSHFIEQLVSLYQNKFVYEGEGRNYDFDGNIIHIIVRKTAIQGHENDWSQLLVSITDVTEINRIHREREALEVRLRHTHKMEAIGTLSGGIAHDFNNILGIIMGSAELALDDIDESSPVRKNLVRICNACLRAKDVIMQLLSFSRKIEQERIRVQMIAVITDTLKLLRSTIPATIEIQAHLNARNDTIIADPTQIHQILINLCTNAAESMPLGGIMEITLDNETITTTKLGESFELPPGEYLTLKVTDKGTGVDPKIKNQIFDPYFTTKTFGDGQGLGLFVVHGIVKNHMGAIWQENRPGGGCAFTVYFPVVESKPDQKPKIDDTIPIGSESILFIDDEKYILDISHDILTRLGYRFTGETDPVKALDRFQAGPDDYDLVVTDMTMPKITGDKLAQTLLEIRPDIPIVLFTGYSQMISEKTARKIGIRAFAMKPLVRKDLATTIRRVLDESK